MKTINLEEIFKSKISEANLEGLNDIVNFIAFNTSEKYFEIVKDSMLEFGKQLLELAAENALYIHEFDGAHGCECKVDRQSILDTINQIK